MCNVLHYERQNKLHLPNKTLEIIKVWIQSGLKRTSLGGQKHTLLQIILICHQLEVEIHFILNDIFFSIKEIFVMIIMFFSDLMSIQRYAVSHAIEYGLKLNAAKGRRKKLRNAQSRNISGVQLQQLL